jgi:glycosyltransferase involved in cell wall biosynthesis
MTPTPLLSVCLITYNHEKYIRQAIEGVLMQEVDFEWELIIADDCSTDGTRAILTEYKEKYPNRISLILQEKNVGPAQNWLDLITAPKSKYIAYFEGDDYWIDKTKLQQQIDFLEKNPGYTLCHSDVKVIDIQGAVVEDHQLKAWNHRNSFLDYRFAIFCPLAFSCTSVFTNTLPVKKLSTKVKAGDWMIWVLLTLQGDAKFIDQKLSIYRLGSGVSVGSLWYKDFHYRALFLLKQITPSNSFAKNKWLMTGVVYYLLFQMGKISRVKKLIYIADKIKFEA